MSGHAQTPPDLTSPFSATAEGWRASDSTATLTWRDSGGVPDGYLAGTGGNPTNEWYFVSPEAWAGDWSGYRVIKFDLSIPSRHYPDADRAGLVVLTGANGQQMTWTTSTPLWTWTHYELDLTPASFGVDATTFDAIIHHVADLRILAEFTSATETVGLDNVLVTASPPQVQSTDLISRFSDGTTQGWRPVDDVTLSTVLDARPDYGLKGDDWMDGRLYKLATPVQWAGDWRAFQELSFDMRWTGEAASHENVELVRIFGANGNSLSWFNSITGGVWIHRVIPLTPASFNVSAEEFAGVMAHVNEMWIFGEFGGSDDITYLDNVWLATGSTAPQHFTRDLVSRFDSGTEGWLGYDNAGITWLPTNGFSGGALQSVDLGGGLARFQSPDAWSGDWREFHLLRFLLRPQTSSRSDFSVQIWIATWDGRALTLTLPRAYGSWTPYSVDLTPETFGANPEEFDAIMSDVACLWIQSDLRNGAGSSDTTLLDNVLLLTQAEPGIPPDRWSDFDVDNENWRTGGWNTGPEDWSFGDLSTQVPTGGHPDGYLRNQDSFDWTYWFTPESWAGDWRGYKAVSFDFNILSGTSLFDTRMISLCSAYTNLHASVSIMPVPGQWGHYEFRLAPETFGVSPEVFDTVMRDVAFLGVRSEWISGSETEALDNFRLSKAPDAYWTWISQYFTGDQMTDENVSGELADPDGDGAGNWSEYVAGTVPTNNLDCLRIEHIAVKGNACHLDFQSHPGRLYTLESSPALSVAADWNPVATDITGTGSLITVTNAITDRPLFYRLGVRTPD